MICSTSRWSSAFSWWAGHRTTVWSVPTFLTVVVAMQVMFSTLATCTCWSTSATVSGVCRGHTIDDVDGRGQFKLFLGMSGIPSWSIQHQ
jgi:hypothetical protein